jgi:hypothetical protein
MLARIYQPTRSAMTSGQANTKAWVLDYVPRTPRRIDPVMGWTGTTDPAGQVRLSFDTREEAEDYARRHGIAFVTVQPKKRKHVIRPKGYGQNFATERRTAWTH